MFTIAQGGLAAWVPMVAHRGWNIPIPVVGKSLGPLMMIAAPLGSFFMGWLMDRFITSTTIAATGYWLRGSPAASSLKCVMLYGTLRK